MGTLEETYRIQVTDHVSLAEYIPSGAQCGIITTTICFWKLLSLASRNLPPGSWNG